MPNNIRNFTAIILAVVIAAIVFVKFFLPNNQKSQYSFNYESSLLAMAFMFSERDGKELKKFYNNLPDSAKYESNILTKYLTYLIRLAEFEDAKTISNIIVSKNIPFRLAENTVFLQQVKTKNQDNIVEFLENANTEDQFVSLFVNLYSAWYLIQEGDDEGAFKIIGSDSSSDLFFNHIARAFYAKGNVKKALEIFKKSGLENSASYSSVYEYINLLIENGEEQEALEVYGNYFTDKPSIENLKELVKQFKITTVNESVSDVLLQISYIISTFDASSGLQLAYYAMLLNEESAGANTHLASLFLNSYKDSALAYSLLKDKDIENIIYYNFFTRNYNSFKGLEGVAYEDILIKIHKSSPQNYAILVDLAYLYMSDNKYKKARNILTYIEQNANLKEDTNVHWYLEFYKGIIYAKFNRLEQAKLHFEKAKELDGKNPIMLNYYAYTLIENNKEIEYAMTMLEKAKSLSDSPEVLDSYAWGLFKQGKYEESKQILEQAIVKIPYNIDVNDHIGDVYWQLGRKQIAIYHWQEALRIVHEKQKSQGYYDDHKRQKAIVNKINGKLPSYLNQNPVDNRKKDYKGFIERYSNKQSKES